MVHLFLAGIAMVFLLNGFHFMYCFSGVERAYLGLYKGIVEEATVVAHTNGGFLVMPKIHLPRLRQLLDEYLLVELEPYCRSYSYAVDPVGTSASSETAAKIVITIAARIDDLHDFHKTAHFKIEEAKNL